MPRMPKATVEIELARISKLVAEHRNGVSRQGIAEEYSARYQKDLSSRTLQRRLERLVISEEIVSAGEGPGTIYQPREPHQPLLAPEEGYLPLSAQGSKLRDLVRRPIMDRAKVGYDPEWLLGYKPGKTWYLSKAVRERLHELGKTPDEDRPAGTFAREVLGRLLIDLAWASSRLEGNTYTRLDTQNLLEFGQRADGKDAQEAQMILNHKGAIEHLVSGAETIGFNRATILTVHAALSENLLGDARDEGRLRERPVSITGTSYTPIAIPQVIQECFDGILKAATEISDPFEQSFFVMVHIPYLQPFADVNKRTSRLAANIPLITGNYCPLSFIDVPEKAYLEATLAVYEHRRVDLLRDVYVHAYGRSSAQYRVIRESLGQPDPIRLRYRVPLAKVVTDVVRAGEPPGANLVRQRAAQLEIPSADMDAFIERALDLLVNLHEGSVGRYQVTPSEFESWSRAHRTKPA